MKAMKAPVSAREAKRRVWAGDLEKTRSSLSKGDLVKNRKNKIVSKKKSAIGKRSPWIQALSAARVLLLITGFAVPKKGTALYKKAKELMNKQAIWALL